MPFPSASEIAASIAAGTLTAGEAVETHIRRIEEVNGRLNAVVVPLFEEARAAARAADAARSRGEPLGPLHGVPITIKDSFDVAGTATTAGLAKRAGHRAAADGPLVARLRAAGAIVLGKTNVPQLLFYHESDNPLYGRTDNPWDAERTPGGSSGGEAAIVAAGGSALGLGSDIGGSIRLPAHFCGIHGLKPTSRRLTTVGAADEWMFAGQEGILAQPGPLARSVEDLALAMRVLDAPGLERVDPGNPPVPWPDPAVVRVEGMRIGWYEHDGFFPAAPALRRAVRDAAAALRDRGADVVEVRPPDATEAMQLFFGILGADGGERLRELLEGEKKDRRIGSLLQTAAMPAPVRAVAAAAAEAAGQGRLAFLIRHARPTSAAGYQDLIARRNRYRDAWLGALDDAGCDAVLFPPHALPALRHGDSFWLPSAASYAFVPNLIGVPAGTVSITRVRPGEESDRAESRDRVERAARGVEEGSAGLPVGVQVAARHWREDVVLGVMAALEEAFPVSSVE